MRCTPRASNGPDHLGLCAIQSEIIDELEQRLNDMEAKYLAMIQAGEVRAVEDAAEAERQKWAKLQAMAAEKLAANKGKKGELTGPAGDIEPIKEGYLYKLSGGKKVRTARKGLQLQSILRSLMQL